MANYNLPARSEPFNGKLYQQMQDDLHLAGMAQRTVHGYLRSVRKLADFFQCSPDTVTEDQLRQWLLHLKIKKQFAYGSLRVAFSGIKFFSTRTCSKRGPGSKRFQRISAAPVCGGPWCIWTRVRSPFVPRQSLPYMSHSATAVPVVRTPKFHGSPCREIPTANDPSAWRTT